MAAVVEIVGGELGDGLHVEGVCRVDDVVKLVSRGGCDVCEELLEEDFDAVASEVDGVTFDGGVWNRCLDCLML